MILKGIGYVLGTLIFAVVVNVALNFISLLLPWKIVAIGAALALAVTLITVLHRTPAA